MKNRTDYHYHDDWMRMKRNLIDKGSPACGEIEPKRFEIRGLSAYRNKQKNSGIIENSA